MKKIDPCVIVELPALTELKSQTYELHGHLIRLPTNRLFVTEDGSIYLVTGRGKTKHYVSIDWFIAEAKKTVVIENFSA